MIFLDGDDLRSILGQNWGYEREQRIELAHVYFRLCSHLVSQNSIVVISAVAMYTEVYDWVKTVIPNSLQVYLLVKKEDRIRRDSETKSIYANPNDFTDIYEEPTNPDLLIGNEDGSDPTKVAKQIVLAFNAKQHHEQDLGRTNHWDTYYSKSMAPSNHSPFSEHVEENLPRTSRILEIGCGNGRDSVFFARKGHIVTAIDRSNAAITKCELDHADSGVEFRADQIDQLPTEYFGSFDVIYTRFVLHAMPVSEEIGLLKAARVLLKQMGTFFAECRSIKDPMARLGEVISPTERIYGHYRRFIILDELVQRIESQGLKLVSSLESKGLASYSGDDPVVIRVAAKKV